jgi:hypothetical protein
MKFSRPHISDDGRAFLPASRESRGERTDALRAKRRLVAQAHPPTDSSGQSPRPSGAGDLAVAIVERLPNASVAAAG